jgi:hypothetical protein
MIIYTRTQQPVSHKVQFNVKNDRKGIRYVKTIFLVWRIVRKVNKYVLFYKPIVRYEYTVSIGYISTQIVFCFGNGKPQFHTSKKIHIHTQYLTN